MKTMKFYTGLSLFAALLLFSGCGKELDELPAGGSNTESPENPAQTEGELLRLRVSDAGYLDADAGSRATDSGLTTTFEDGDKIGLFVVNNKNEVLYANVPYTKNKEGWTAKQKVRTKGYPVRVFAYYPYVEDAKIVEKINKKAQDASAFFKTYIDDLDITDQSTPKLYRQADVMACMVTIDNAEAARDALTLTMNHLMGLVVVKLPTEVTLSSVNYYLKGDEDFIWKVEDDVTLPANLSGESLTVTVGIQPLKEETGYRYLCKSGDNNISFSGDFTTYEAAKSYTGSGTVSAGSIKTYNVSVTRFAAPGKAEYTPQPGDFYMKDGRVLSRVTSSNKADCIGIVYWVPTATEPLESHKFTWLEEHSTCIHGLVVGLKVKQSSWGTYGETTDITDSKTDDIFRGYSNTKRLANEYSDYAIVSAYNRLKSGVTLPPGKTSGWYVPSVGELKMLCQAKYEVNYSLSTLDSTEPLSSFTYWSSGEDSPYSAWTVGMNTGRESTPLKSADRYYVRLSFAF